MTPSAQNQQDLLALEHAMWSEDKRFDVAFQEETFADDFMEFGRSGRTYTRTQIIRTDWSPFVAKLKNLVVHELNSATALITYESEAKFGSEVEHALRSSVWVRTVTGGECVSIKIRHVNPTTWQLLTVRPNPSFNPVPLRQAL